MPVQLTRKSHFCAAHRLFNPELSEVENSEIYGECANPYGHGHTYYLETTIVGEPDPKTGMIVNISELNKIIKEEIIQKCDHRHLNHDVPLLQGIIPTMENMIQVFWKVLSDRLHQEGYSFRLKELRLWESEKNYVTYHGEYD